MYHADHPVIEVMETLPEIVITGIAELVRFKSKRATDAAF